LTTSLRLGEGGPGGIDRGIEPAYCCREIAFGPIVDDGLRRLRLVFERIE
jgi:hypothetical protein